jgi:hypothetical protein
VLKKAILTLSLLLAGAVLLLAENIGEIVYFEGEISIQRDTSVLTELDIDFGEGIQNYDLVTTGPNSYVEIELFASTGIAGTIKMDPGSAFYLEISELRAEQVGNVELLAGRLNFQIDKMAGSSGFEVRTQAAVMGVRGTTFSVITAPQGEILVTTREGRVEVSDSEGSVSYAQPGQVVEASEENPIQTIPATVDTLEGFEKNWVASRIEAFRGNAPRAIANYARRFEQLRNQFKRSFQRLEDVRDILDKWKTEDRSGRIGGRMELMREKRQVIGALLAIRRNVFMFERVYYRLSELKTYVDQDGITGNIRGGYSIRDFYRDFARESVEIRRMLSEYRFILKLYSKRNDGRNPVDEFGDDAFGDDNFGSSDGFDSPDLF